MDAAALYTGDRDPDGVHRLNDSNHEEYAQMFAVDAVWFPSVKEDGL